MLDSQEMLTRWLVDRLSRCFGLSISVTFPFILDKVSSEINHFMAYLRLRST